MSSSLRARKSEGKPWEAGYIAEEEENPEIEMYRPPRQYWDTLLNTEHLSTWRNLKSLCMDL